MKRKILNAFLILFVIVILTTLFINIYMVKTTENNIIEISDLESLNDIDAILVLGCKTNGNYPSMMLQNRLEKGIEVYNILHTKLLLSGDHGKKNYDEVNAMKDYILNYNIDRSDIFLDHAGFSTYDSMYRAKHVFTAKKIIVITQKYHMSRALYIAKALDLDAKGILADDIPYKSIMLKNEIREFLSRNKNFIKVIFKPRSKYLGEVISLNGDGNITNG